jgi:putative phosphoribosyl transferase
MSNLSNTGVKAVIFSRFRDRAEAGQRLSERLADYKDRKDVIVLALPRGGVPVGFQIATRLGADFDLLLVRKLGVPGHEELAMGAIALDGTRVLNEDVVQMLNISSETLKSVAEAEKTKLDRLAATYRGASALPKVQGRVAIVVDDGLATGATARVALQAVRAQNPLELVLAVPVAPPSTIAALSRVADRIVCDRTPDPFLAVGAWYADFSQVSDEEVRQLLQASRRPVKKPEFMERRA